MLNYSDDTLTTQLYVGLLDKDWESINMDGKREGFQTDKLVGKKKENEGSSASGEENLLLRFLVNQTTGTVI